MPYKPQAEPGRTDYQADVQITRLGEKIGDPVAAAEFPDHILRFRNDRWDKSVGLDRLDEQQWIAHFGKFQPLPDNLDPPLALRYHGHQFRNYNPDIGDGRGFLFAQLRDHEARLMDLGTKGSGTTPWSRTGDGRLTLKGAVREILATEMLEALGVNTSKTFSVVETGEKLMRGDEPSPTRSAVMTRLSHSHIRIGAFQRIAYEQNEPLMRQLVDYCLENYYGGPRTADPATELFARTTGEVARLTAAYMTAGFVHGVLNTDNMNISGESFDYGPWRFLPQWEPGFTAAYFDHAGLYAFGRQPEALHWNCGQLAVALRLVCDAPPLIAALERFGSLYMEAVERRWCWRLGVESQGAQRDGALVAASEQAMRASGDSPDSFFYRHRGGRDAEGGLAEALSGYEASNEAHPYWSEVAETMVIEEVERIWSAIDRDDDWQTLSDKVAAIRRMGEAHGKPPRPAGQ